MKNRNYKDNNTSKKATTIVVTVFDKKTEKRLFKATSTTVDRRKIRAIVDPKTAPGDILFGGGYNEITKAEADQILALMGEKFDDTGKIFISVERVIKPGDPV